MINTLDITMALEYETLSDEEIRRFAKNQAGLKYRLSKMTFDETYSFVKRIDDMISSTGTKNMYVQLMKLKAQVLADSSRENFAGG